MVESFRQFVEQEEKLWSAKKDDILKYWNNLRPDIPAVMMPVEKGVPGEKKRSYGEDMIRISGSSQFIASVLSRMKHLIAYESPTTKLRLIFKEIDSPRRADPTKPSYVFYANVENRTHGKPGRPRKFGSTFET